MNYEPSLPVSEKSNPLTRDIDQASAYSIVKMLQLCDSQMFQEEAGTAYQVYEYYKNVLCLFFYDYMLSPFLYAHVLRALLSSQEAPEDDPRLGVLSLKKVCEGKKRVLFIGISCGLSAPFVAGQLDFCLQHPEVYMPVLVGFNPAHQARDEPIQDCTFTFHSVVQRMQELAKSQKAFLINPAVGPEAISGSSRMKGGSATKILLEVAFSAAHAATFSNTPITYNGVLEHMKAYERTLDVTYSQTDGITTLVEAAGQSLRCSRHVYYLGWGSLALLGLIDASECTPTFGADYEDVRGFISGGYRELNNNDGPLTSLGPKFSIAHEDFLHLILPCLTDKDTVLLIYTHPGETVLCLVREKTPNLHAVYHQADGDTAASLQQDDIKKLCLSTLKITWPREALASGTLQHMQRELSTKLVLNAVSTGAHVLKGKIYQNHMIDLQVTNTKLYRRATRLLQKLSACPEENCEEALLKAIYRVDMLTVEMTSSDITTHTCFARNSTKVKRWCACC
uniref:SIS domain-containing protein n=1 Tax=Oreochromis niloticus TaxID=8128 RepID=A0A669E8Y4_ORENI